MHHGLKHPGLWQRATRSLVLFSLVFIQSASAGGWGDWSAAARAAADFGQRIQANSIVQGTGQLLSAGDLQTKINTKKSELETLEKDSKADPAALSKLKGEIGELEKSRDEALGKAGSEFSQFRDAVKNEIDNLKAAEAATRRDATVTSEKATKSGISYKVKTKDGTEVEVTQAYREALGANKPYAIVCGEKDCHNGAMKSAREYYEKEFGKDNVLTANSEAELAAAGKRAASAGADKVVVTGHGDPGVLHVGGGETLNADNARQIGRSFDGVKSVDFTSCSFGGCSTTLKEFAKGSNAVSTASSQTMYVDAVTGPKHKASADIVRAVPTTGGLASPVTSVASAAPSYRPSSAYSPPSYGPGTAPPSYAHAVGGHSPSGGSVSPLWAMAMTSPSPSSSSSSSGSQEEAPAPKPAANPFPMPVVNTPVTGWADNDGLIDLYSVPLSQLTTYPRIPRIKTKR